MWTSTKFIHMIPMGSKLTLPQGVTSWNIGTKKPIFKTLLSETERRRDLIFGMWHLLVDLYQMCSYDAPGIKSGPALGGGGSQVEHRNKERKFHNSSFLKLESLEL